MLHGIHCKKRTFGDKEENISREERKMGKQMKWEEQGAGREEKRVRRGGEVMERS